MYGRLECTCLIGIGAHNWPIPWMIVKQIPIKPAYSSVSYQWVIYPKYNRRGYGSPSGYGPYVLVVWRIKESCAQTVGVRPLAIATPRQHFLPSVFLFFVPVFSFSNNYMPI